MGTCVYMLQCADGSYYVGVAEDMSRRLYEHESGVNPKSYTYHRRPVKLVWCEKYPTRYEALTHECQIKGWNKKKKEALIKNDLDAIHELVKAERKSREKKPESVE